MKVAGLSANWDGCWNTSMRAVVAAALCVLMVEQPLLAAPLAGSKPKAAPVAQLQGDEKVLHALNRLTFGPRPGDVEAVKAMGLNHWIDRQLNPMSVDDSAFEARLAEFPAMKLTQAELVERFPSPQVIREMIRTNAPLPSDSVEHAVYADQIAFYKIAQAKREAAAAANTTANNQAMNGGQATPTNDAAMNGADAETKGADALNEAMNAPSSPDPTATAPTKVKGKNKGVDLLGEGGKGKKQTQQMSMAEDAGKTALPGDNVDPATPAMATHEEQFYSGLEAVKIINLPPDQRVQRILAMQPQDLIDFRKSLSRSELTAMGQGLSPEQKETIASLQGSQRVVGAEVLQTRLLRDVYSDRQLEAVMTDFWLNHFNVYIRKNQNEQFLLPAYERDVIRPNAMGKFENLLVATAQSPAMLMYLDNWQSVGPDSQAARNAGRAARLVQNPQAKQALKDRGLNENYARELMELHTLGVQCEVSQDRPVSDLPAACGSGYTQQDVTQVARVLTGWTIDRPYRGGEYHFEEKRHEPGTKLVLGRNINEGGEREGLQVLHMLATSPATAHFISYKLAVRFVSDTPPDALVDRMASSFLSSGGDIKTVLRTMFSAPEFWSPDVYRAKVKTPLEFVASAARASQAEIGNAQPLVQALDRLGMPLYGMQTPNGYNWTSEPWVSTGALVNRMNFALVLSGNRLPGTRTDWTRLLSTAPASNLQAVSYDSSGNGAGSADQQAAVKERELEGLLLGQPASDQTRSTVLKEFDDQTAQQQAEKNFPIKANDPEFMANALPGGTMANQEDKPKFAPVDQQAATMAGLLIGSPEFQKR